MVTREMETTLFGRDVEFEYSERWVGYSLLGLRVVMGWTLFYAGVEKLLDPTWSAEGFLRFGIPEANPFTGLWMTIADD